MKRKGIRVTAVIVVFLMVVSMKMTVLASEAETGSQSVNETQILGSELSESQKEAVLQMIEQLEDQTIVEDAAEELFSNVKEKVSASEFETEKIIEDAQNAVKKSLMDSLRNFFVEMFQRMKEFFVNIFS